MGFFMNTLVFSVFFLILGFYGIFANLTGNFFQWLPDKSNELLINLVRKVYFFVGFTKIGWKFKKI